MSAHQLVHVYLYITVALLSAHALAKRIALIRDLTDIQKDKENWHNQPESAVKSYFCKSQNRWTLGGPLISHEVVHCLNRRVEFPQPHVFVRAKVKAVAYGPIASNDTIEILLGKNYTHKPEVKKEIKPTEALVCNPSNAGIEKIVWQGQVDVATYVKRNATTIALCAYSQGNYTSAAFGFYDLEYEGIHSLATTSNSLSSRMRGIL
jgi:hypothetical protein